MPRKQDLGLGISFSGNDVTHGVFHRQNEDARARWADREPDELAEPPRVHDPRRPSALANRRMMTPSPIRTATNTTTPQKQPAAGSEGSTAKSTSSADSSTATSSTSSASTAKAPTSGQILEILEARGDEDAAKAFQLYNEDVRDMLFGQSHEIRRLEKEKEELKNAFYVPQGPSKRLERKMEERPGKGFSIGGGGRSGSGGGRSGSSGIGEGEQSRPPSGGWLGDWTGSHIFSSPRTTTSEDQRPAKHRQRESWEQQALAKNARRSVSRPTEKLLEHQTRLRLMPAIMLLNESAPLKLDTAKRAHKLVQAAYDEVRAERNDPLIGVCAFYMGVCRLAMTELEGKDHKPTLWFKKAESDAKGLYVEGEWAHQWSKAYKEAKAESPLGQESSRPGTADSKGTTDSERFVGKQRPQSWASVFSKLAGLGSSISEGKLPPLNMLRDASERNVDTDGSRPSTSGQTATEPSGSPNTRQEEVMRRRDASPESVAPRRMGMGERIASFSTFQSGAAGDAAGSPLSDDHGQLGMGSGLKVTNSALSSPTQAADEPADRSAQSPSPTSQKSPSRPGIQGRKLSIAFTLKSALGSREGSPAQSPTSSIGESASKIANQLARRASMAIHAKTTGAQRSDAFATAEEGMSPFRSTFDGIEEEGLRRRKKSAEDMV